MSGVGPTLPFHIAQAYQVQAPARPASVQPLRAADTAGAIKPAPAEPQRTSVQRMIAGVVPGGVSFAGTDPTQAGPALPMYRHPADKNAAATSLSAGRLIDVQA